MRVIPSALDGVLLIEPKVFADDRGFFLETYGRDNYRRAGIAFDFVQDNRSRSDRGVLRGLHYQEPHAQGKLVQVVRGAIFDVAVDIRLGSPNFGRWSGVELTGDNHLQIWIPPGFAHGFLTMADQTDVTYKCTDEYAPQHQHTLLWNDPAIGIVWPDLGTDYRLSAKDLAGMALSELKVLPTYAGH
jgi:dTDP-4-dehydrorhamnose 3,5-epimerase